MRRITARAISVLIAAGMIMPLFAIGAAHAALSGSGYKVFPIRTDLTINRGSSKSVTVYLQNVSGTTEKVTSVFDDFVANPNESGSPDLLLNGESNHRHGLKQFVSLSPASFSLAPQAEETVKVNITVPKDADSGGYYGAVRFAPASLNGQKNVNLSASVASLVLIKVPGNYSEDVSVQSFSAARNGVSGSFFTSSNNLQALVVFKNSGEVQEEPFGKVILLKGNKQLGTFPVNQVSPPGNVLPGSARKFSTNLSGVGSFGKYTLNGNFGYGSKGQLLSVSTTFWVVPLAWIIGAIVVVVIIILLIVWWVHKRSQRRRRF